MVAVFDPGPGPVDPDKIRRERLEKATKKREEAVAKARLAAQEFIQPEPEPVEPELYTQAGTSTSSSSSSSSSSTSTSKQREAARGMSLAKAKLNARTLTAKEAKFAALIPHTRSYSEAARLAGYSPSTVAKTLPEILKRERVAGAIQEALYAAGMSTDFIAEQLRNAVDANAYTTDIKGNVIDLGPDWHARLKALELTTKIGRMMPDPKLEVSGPGGGAIVVRHTMSLDVD